MSDNNPAAYKAARDGTPAFRLLPATEADRTYICRLNLLADTYGDNFGTVSDHFDDSYDFYVERWSPADGGVIAWDGSIPAGGVWLCWGKGPAGVDPADDGYQHGFGHYKEGIPELALAVEERYKGQGLGTRLIEAAYDIAREHGANAISLSVDPENERAHRLYKYLGFEHVEGIPGHYVLVKQL